jgi:hypothetical protein
MKKSLFFLLLTVISLLIVGCFSDPVKEDLEDYVNNGVLPLMSDEEEILALYDSVTGNNYTNDFILYETIQEEIIPKYRRFIDNIEAIRPTTPEVRKIHEIYIHASNEQFNAMVMILDAIDYQDHGLLKDANEKLHEARTLLRNFQYELDDLLDKHNLEVE